MKRLITILLLCASITSAQVSLTPDTFTFTWTRQGTTAPYNANVYLSGVTYLLTNCQAMNGTDVQDLTGCGIIIRVGDSTTNTAFTGIVQSPATGGLFSCYVTIPPSKGLPLTTASTYLNAQTGSTIPATYLANIQMAITSGAVTVIDREQKQLYYTIPLH